ncbi:TetR family transcriptional regulator [Aquibacillus halophilus]|uniref:TetR family transcriptional regulator n=1 Tax=Aquibacillus halophilus TaxID=930132 RepID=A0A6A8DFD5_9BACI|nr:TetR/AcrR family transcriptional regulator [Aquibacillus halophilus]MRH43940.1 TetR family transcriptional regulator [Aquibacillus halophilus]
MNDKKKKIIEESIKLFAQKGLHATSIQQIADESNVSKGAFYLYFKSKEELTVAIFEYYSEIVFEKVERIASLDIEPKEKLAKQIDVFLEMLTNHKEYIIMHFRDNLQLGDQLDHFIMKMNKQSFEWTKMNLLAIYGEAIQPYLVDASIQLDGMLQGYCKNLVVHDLKVDTKELAAFIVRRLDDLVRGMITSKDHPQVTVEQLSYHNLLRQENVTDTNKVETIISSMLEKVNQTPLDKESKQQLEEAAEVIKSEVAKQNPKKIIIQGMLTHFQAIPALKADCQKIAQILTINLLLQD